MKNPKCPTLFSLLLSTIGFLQAQPSENWPHWRGPNQNGVSETANPPITWSHETNVEWSLLIPGSGSSTPIVWDKRMYTLSAEKLDKTASEPFKKADSALTEPPTHFYQLLLHCIHLETGKRLWTKVVDEILPHEGHHQTHTYAGGSPTTDGNHLYVSFGSFGLYCFDMEGHQKWKRSFGRMRTRRGWGEANTPALSLNNSRLLVPWDHEDESFLYCLDAKTGSTIWKVQRDEPSNWSTPVLLRNGTEEQVVLNGTQRARGYNLEAGEVIWEMGELSVNAIPTPLFDEDHIYCMSGYRKTVVYAIPRSARGDLTETAKVTWSYDRNTPYVASPLLYQGILYMTRQRSTRLTTLRARDGQLFQEAEQIEGLSDIYASPVAAAGRLYFIDRRGTTAVLEAGKTPRVLSVNKLNDTVDASPLLIGNQIYIRSWNRIYCLKES